MSGKNDISFLNKKVQSKFAHYQDIEKNESKLGFAAINTCSQTCFENLKTDFVTNNENVCLTRCFKKYLDSVYMGEQIFDSLSNKSLKSNILAEGKFDSFVAEAKKQFDL